MRLPVELALPLAALILLGAGTVAAKDRPNSPVEPSGPAADYPVVTGAPFTIGSTVWTPADQLNYDAVGYASVDASAAPGITGAHKTLPLPCYVEVTALDTGKTILVRLERRGPMVNDVLVELSGDAATQLGLAQGKHSPIRLRRVNPPEQERAALRGGVRAPERMETPEGLLKVLRRKLADQSPLVPPPSTPPAMPAKPLATAPVAKAPPPKVAGKPVAKVPVGPAPKPTVAAPPPAKPAPSPAPLPAAVAKGSVVVQVGAFSVEANARKIAEKLGGQVSHAGKFWRVRMGPFANSAQAGAALEKARRAGYSDARIQPSD
jgi:rare lipoprotein A